MKEKVNAKIRAFVLRKNQTKNYLGVRAVAQLASKKFGLAISKSTIHNILKLKGVRKKKGRKLSFLQYKKTDLPHAGLFLLRALDSEVGLFEAAAKQLLPLLKGVSLDSLQKLLTFLSFSAWLNKDIDSAVFDKGLLRLSGLYVLPKNKLTDLIKQLNNLKPHLDFSRLLNTEKKVSSIKFNFSNGGQAFLDAGLTTFWDKVCGVERFHLPLSLAKKKLARQLKNKLLAVNYTKSFDYLSKDCFDFIQGLASGITKISFLDEQALVLDKQEFTGEKLEFIVGYYPKILSRGAIFLEKPKRIKRLSLVSGQLWCAAATCKFIRPHDPKGLQLRNVILSRKGKFLPVWAVLASKRERTEDFFKNYLYTWPALEQGFIDDLKTIEQDFVRLDKVIIQHPDPEKNILLETTKDLGKIVQNLLILFQARCFDAKIEDISGQIVWGKDFCQIKLNKTPAELKDKFNRACLYIEGRRAFLA